MQTEGEVRAFVQAAGIKAKYTCMLYFNPGAIESDAWHLMVAQGDPPSAVIIDTSSKLSIFLVSIAE